MRWLCIGGLAVLLAAPTGLRAQDVERPPEPGSPWTANVTLASQYVARGFRQTWGRPALQGGVDYAAANGFSAGTWLSNVSDKYIEGGRVEWDLYGGYSGAIDALGYSAILYYYQYPGAAIGATGVRYDYGELSLGLSYRFFSLKYNYTLTRDYFGITDARGTGYLDLGVNWDLGAGYTLNLHYGNGRLASRGAADNSVWNWQDYKIGLSKSLPDGWTLAGAYTRARGATDAYQRYTTGVPASNGVPAVSDPSAGTFVLTLGKVF